MTPQEFETLPIQVSDGGAATFRLSFSASLPGTVASGGDPTNGPWSGSHQRRAVVSHGILIDGVTIGRFDLSGGGLTEFQPGTDSIAEFKVLKPKLRRIREHRRRNHQLYLQFGTNQFHGLLFEYLQVLLANAGRCVPRGVSGHAKDNVKENDLWI